MRSVLKINQENLSRYLSLSILVLFFSLGCYAQSSYRPSLFFREDWTESPAAVPINQQHVTNENLILNLYGPGSDSIKKSHHVEPIDDPYYVWSGLCPDNWVVTLKDKNFYANLSSFARIRWCSKQDGLRELHVVLKLADGSWLVSKQSDGPSKDWRIHEFNISDIDWYNLDINEVVETIPFKNPDLTRVDEIGFTDLMKGGKSDACSRVDWVEVYGNKVDRKSCIR